MKGDVLRFNPVTHNVDNLTFMMREAVHSRELIENTRKLYLQQQIPLTIIIIACLVSLVITISQLRKEIKTNE